MTKQEFILGETIMTQTERYWLVNAITYGGRFIQMFAKTAFVADEENYAILQPAVQALMGQLRYSNTTDDPTAGGTALSRALTVTVNDGGNTGVGALTAAPSKTAPAIEDTHLACPAKIKTSHATRSGRGRSWERIQL
jgi:hypothetical protein